MTADQIKALCREHGAKKVSDAAYAAMTGSRSGLAAVGLGDVAGLGNLHNITTIAYGCMSEYDQALDGAQAAIDAAKIK